VKKYGMADVGAAPAMRRMHQKHKGKGGVFHIPGYAAGFWPTTLQA